MKNSNLGTIIKGYQSVIDSMPDFATYEYPDDNPNFNFKEVTDSVFDSMENLLHAMLQTEHFLLLKKDEMGFVIIYDNIEDLNRMLNNPTNQNEIIVEKIDYNGFLQLVKGAEIFLEDYICDDRMPCVIFPLPTNVYSSIEENTD